MRRMIVVITIGVMLFGMITAYAAGENIIKVHRDSGAVGEQVRVEITISANSNACVGTFNIHYDDTKLELVSCEEGEIIKNLSPLINNNYTSSAIRVGFMTLKPIKSEGVLCTAIFKIIANEGFANIQVDEISLIDIDEKQIVITTENGGIEIKKPAQAGGGGGGIVVPNINQQSVFEDLSNYSWATKEITALSQNGIIKGTTTKTFSPQNEITRADYMLLMVRMLKLKVEVEDNFSDVPSDSYYYNEIGIAKKLGLTTGVGNNQFHPKEHISRQDMFVIAYRILSLQGVVTANTEIKELDSFLDKNEISDYASGSFVSLINNGLIKGNDHMLNPKGNATRAETAVFIYRLNEFLKKS